jgi:hypothetical protein
VAIGSGVAAGTVVEIVARDMSKKERACFTRRQLFFINSAGLVASMTSSLVSTSWFFRIAGQEDSAKSILLGTSQAMAAASVTTLISMGSRNAIKLWVSEEYRQKYGSSFGDDWIAEPILCSVLAAIPGAIIGAVSTAILSSKYGDD